MKNGPGDFSSKFSVPNVERALSIFETLMTSPDGYTLSEIAQQLKLPRNSVFRITNALLLHHYVTRDEKTRKYGLSHKLFGIAYNSASTRTLMENSMDIMRQLRDEVTETTIISVMSDGAGLVLEQVPAVHAFRFVCDAGLRQPVNASASPKAMMAFMPENAVEEILIKAKLQKFTSRTITGRQVLREHLQEIRKQGFALDIGEHIEGVNCAGAPILNQQGYAVAAVTVIGPTFRMPVESLPAIGQTVRSYADKISTRFGHGLVKA